MVFNKLSLNDVVSIVQPVESHKPRGLVHFASRDSDIFNRRASAPSISIFQHS